MRFLSLLVIRVYRVTLGPLFALFSGCRFHPTCSQYAMDAIRLHGTRRGWWLAVKRIGRCNPWGGHGYDPVPEEYLTRSERRRRERAGQVGAGGGATS